MSAEAAGGLRALARGLADGERMRRMATVTAASDLALLRAVVGAGVGGGEWRSTSDCAERALVVEPRTLRRWLSGDEALVLPEAVRTKLEVLAFAFAVEVTAPDGRDFYAAVARVVEEHAPALRYLADL